MKAIKIQNHKMHDTFYKTEKKKPDFEVLHFLYFQL